MMPPHWAFPNLAIWRSSRLLPKSRLGSADFGLEYRAGGTTKIGLMCSIVGPDVTRDILDPENKVSRKFQNGR